jgi:hypothetical protein
MLAYGVANPCSIPTLVFISLFLITMYIMTMETIKFHLFLSLCIYLFSSFPYSHLKLIEVQLVSHVITKIKLLLHNTSQNVLTTWPIASICLCKGLFYSSTVAQFPHKVCVWLIEKFHFVRATLAQETIKKQPIACWSVCHCGKINLYVKILKLLFRLSMRYS